VVPFTTQPWTISVETTEPVAANQSSH